MNPVAVYEGLLGWEFLTSTHRRRIGRRNAGEFLFPESRWSLLPLLLVSGGLSNARRAHRAAAAVQQAALSEGRRL